MAFCTNCGAKLADDAKFCTECGTKVESVPSEPVTQPDNTPAAPANDYTYSAPASDYTYTPAAQNTASSGSYSPEITRNTYSYDPAAASPSGTQPPRPPRDIPGGSQPEKRKSSFLPFLLIAIGVAALVFLLIGYFGNRSGDVYNVAYGIYDGRTYTAEEIFEEGFTIELFSNGKCQATISKETETCRYELDDNGNIDIMLYDGEMHGVLTDNKIVFKNVFDSDMDLIFYKEGTVVPAVEVPAATEAPAIDTPVATAEPVESAYSWWDGDWYGWWIAYNAGGDYEDFVDSWADVCATIYVDGDTGLVDIWDDTCEEGENIAYVDVTFKPGKSDKGRMLSESGYFLFTDVNSGDWVVDPGDSFVSRFDQMICIRAVAADPENSDNWIDYMIFLRPWGMSWEDVRSDDCEDMPYTTMMPYYYDDWYVPHMDGAMPEYFDLGDETA